MGHVEAAWVHLVQHILSPAVGGEFQPTSGRVTPNITCHCKCVERVTMRKFPTQELGCVHAPRHVRCLCVQVAVFCELVSTIDSWGILLNGCSAHADVLAAVHVCQPKKKSYRKYSVQSRCRCAEG